LPSVFTATLGKDSGFAECLLPSALTLALGKAAVTVDPLSWQLFLPRVDSALGKAFAECPTKSTRQSHVAVKM
jgi:hypothetical protein